MNKVSPPVPPSHHIERIDSSMISCGIAILTNIGIVHKEIDGVRFFDRNSERYCSIQDLLMMITTKHRENARKIWDRHGDAWINTIGLENFFIFKFKGRGQHLQPCISLKKVFQLLQYIPGRGAEEFRQQHKTNVLKALTETHAATNQHEKKTLARNSVNPTEDTDTPEKTEASGSKHSRESDTEDDDVENTELEPKRQMITALADQQDRMNTVCLMLSTYTPLQNEANQVKEKSIALMFEEAEAIITKSDAECAAIRNKSDAECAAIKNECDARERKMALDREAIQMIKEQSDAKLKAAENERRAMEAMLAMELAKAQLSSIPQSKDNTPQPQLARLTTAREMARIGGLGKGLMAQDLEKIICAAGRIISHKALDKVKEGSYLVNRFDFERTFPEFRREFEEQKRKLVRPQSQNMLRAFLVPQRTPQNKTEQKLNKN